MAGLALGWLTEPVVARAFLPLLLLLPAGWQSGTAYAIAAALASARARFGVAVLLDVHSMPPLGNPATAARLVPGDRFGKSAAGRFLGRIEGVARAHGIRTMANTPYSGGHILERHGDPRRGVHAIQLEFDRSLYLDSALDQPGPGLATAVRLLRDLIDAVADEALPGAIAAE